MYIPARASPTLKYANLVAFVIAMLCCYTSFCQSSSQFRNNVADEERRMRSEDQAWGARVIYDEAPSYQKAYITDLIKALKRTPQQSSEEVAMQQLKRLGNRKFQTQGWKRKRDVSHSSKIHHPHHSSLVII